MLQQHFFVVVVLADALKLSNHKLAPPHPPTILISVGGIYFNDILMDRFVMSQHPENNVCSPNEPFVVVLEKGFFNEISPFGVDFEVCNFVDLFYAQTYTLHTD